MEPLFRRLNGHSFFRGKEQELREEIKSLTNEELQYSDDAIKIILKTKHLIKKIEFGEYYREDKGEIDIDISNDRRFSSFYFKDLQTYPTYKTGRRLDVHLPFTGEIYLFSLKPSSYTSTSPVAEIKDNELIFTFHFFSDVDSPEDVRKNIDQEIDLCKKYSNWLNTDIESFNNGIDSIIDNGLLAKREKVSRDEDFLKGLDIPESGKISPLGFVKPELKLDLKILSEDRENEIHPTLEFETYKEIVTFINSLGINLERSSRRLRDLGEEPLRDTLLMALNSVYRGMASGEAFNKEGKTDILIKYKDTNIFIAECKIWRTEDYFSEGIDQLLSYLTWRDSKTSYIIFSKNLDVSNVIKRARELSEVHPNFIREEEHISVSCVRYIFKQNIAGSHECRLTLHIFNLGER